VALNAVDPQVEHIVFVINSYTEQELDDIAMASCHLFDPTKRVDLCTYTLTNNASLDKHTALLLADLYRDASTRDWMMRILSVPSQGKTARVSRRGLLQRQRALRLLSPGVRSHKSSNDLLARNKRCIGHVVDYLKKVPPTAAAIPPDPEIVMTKMPVAVPLDGEISFTPVEGEIVSAQSLVKE